MRQRAAPTDRHSFAVSSDSFRTSTAGGVALDQDLVCVCLLLQYLLQSCSKNLAARKKRKRVRQPPLACVIQGNQAWASRVKSRRPRDCVASSDGAADLHSTNIECYQGSSINSGRLDPENSPSPSEVDPLHYPQNYLRGVTVFWIGLALLLD